MSTLEARARSFASRATAGKASSSNALRLAGAAALSAIASLVAARIGVAPTAALILLPAAALAALRRPIVLLYASVLLSTAVPASFAFGPATLSAYRLAAVLALGYLMANILVERAKQPSLSLPEVILALYLGVILGSGLLWGPGVPVILIMNALTPFMIYLAVRRVDNAQRRAILWVMLAGGSIGALSVLYETFITHTPTFVDAANYHWKQSSRTLFRGGGVYTGPPQAGTVLGLILVACAPLYFNERPGGRLIARCLGLLILAATFLTFTRAPLIGLGVAVLMLMTIPQRLGRAISVLVTLIVMAAVAATFVLPTVSNSRVFQQGFVRPGQLEVRESYWEVAAPLVTSGTKAALLGFGAEFTTAVKLGQVTDVPSDMAKVPLVTGFSVHSQFMTTALELGIPGVVILIAWLVSLVVTGVGLARRAVGPRRLEATGFAGAIVVVAAAMYANELHYPVVLAPLALVAGLIRSIGPRES